MYVCVCNAVTDREIRAAVAGGARSVGDLSMLLGVGAGCGCCRDAAAALVRATADCCGNCENCPHATHATALAA